MIDNQEFSSDCLDDRLGLWQRIVLYHKQRFSEHPYVITVMLVLSAHRLYDIGIVEWPSNIPLYYFLSFVFVPAFFRRNHETQGISSDSPSGLFSSADSQSSRSIHQGSFSGMGSTDLNRYHPHSSVNPSSPFYRK